MAWKRLAKVLLYPHIVVMLVLAPIAAAFIALGAYMIVTATKKLKEIGREKDGTER